MAQRNPEYTIQLFGGFSMRCGRRVLKEEQNRMHQVWNCLQYLITHRMEQITQAVLIEALWPNGDITEPTNALKNIIYRVRTVLSEAFPEEKRSFILSSRGCYSWNNSITYYVDAERFERLIRQAQLPEQNSASRELLLKEALSLYTGGLLPRTTGERWSTPLRTYYRHLFLNASILLTQQCMNEQKYEAALTIARKATEMEPYDESIHALLIQALAGTGDYKGAMEHYDRVSELFYNTLGTRVSSTISDLYNQIAKPVEKVATDIALIQQSLRGTVSRDGPFFCEYNLFKSIYGTYSYLIARTGQSMSLLLLTISDTQGQVPPARQLAVAMETLRSATANTLRRSDIVARFSPSQYILLLCGTTKENCDIISNRVRTKFEENCVSTDICLTQTACPVLPGQ